jgi:predicted amidohydrolase
MTPFRIAVTQPAIAADVHANGRTVRRLMREAAAGQARLVQFPEGMLSGYPKEQFTEWDQVDWAAVHDELAQVIVLAARLQLWVVLGSAHPLSAPNRPHNSLYVISDQGEVVDRYDKRFCSHTEITRFYSPGFEPVVFNIDGIRFGCALCIEINFPEVFSEYERLGVDCVLLSAYPGTADATFSTKSQAHAAINANWVALSAPAQTAALTSCELVGPDGSPVAPVARTAELLIGELDRDDPRFVVALTMARPWRATAHQGHIYESRRVSDPRSADRTCW